jgi:hypothetical protein
MECGESRQGRMNMKKLLLASVAALSVLSTSVAYPPMKAIHRCRASGPGSRSGNAMISASP